MGGEWSIPERELSHDPWWGNSQPGTSRNGPSRREENREKTEERTRRKVNQEEMDAFKKELAKKRELRHAAIASVQSEMKKLRTDLETERTLRKAAEDERDQLAKSNCDKKLLEEVERLKTELEEEKIKRKEIEEENNKLKDTESELEAAENQVKALKEVASIGREMLRIRELQVNELKKKLQEIELSLPTAPEELRLEYETQIQNIRKLRTLYEERALATRTEHQQERERDTAKINMLEIKVKKLEEELEENKDQSRGFEVKISKFEETVEEKVNEIESLEDQLYSSSIECRSLKSQMKIINNLFSQVLAGPEFDLDKLTRLLKENHGLINELTATGDGNDVAALLIDIAEKAEGESQGIPGSDDKQDQNEENIRKEKDEIASNLSKVWRVLEELLSHRKDINTNNAGGSESCYKSVDTPSGPRLVISVSQTFLTLKDLILEKNSLVKEVGRLKTLNGHLETRLHSQERRLSTVSTELKKTWSVVSKLRAQHKQLHNHEKILRYELQHKRQMLNELKEELEHCREKWDRARQKNTQSEEDWKQLRKEFALRKMRKLSNSAESGYEEEDSHSSPTEEISEQSDSIDHPHPINIIHVKQDTSESSEGDLSEEDVEHSDGNSYETVIDLLDIACLESQIENENLTNTEHLISFIQSQDALPLTDNEFTEGLSHIESFELASELNICRRNVPTPDFSSPFPSSTPSPIPTEIEDLMSSDIDTSEEVPRSVSPFYQLHFTQEPIVVPEIPQDTFLFGSNSAQNIQRFLDGLIDTDIPSSSVSRASAGEEWETKMNEQLNETCLPGISRHEENTVSQKQSNIDSSEGEDLMSTQPSTKEKTDTAVVENSVPKSENGLLTHYEELLSTNNTTKVEITTKILTPNFKYEIPKILIVSEPEHNQETPEITDNVNNENSVFDNECVANAIQLCLQDIQNSIPIPTENETVEVNNNIPTILEPNTTKSVEDTTATAEENPEQRKRQQLLIENEETPEQKIEPSISEYETSVKSCENAEIKNTRTSKEILEARAARLKRLEEQCKSLFSKMSATSRRSDLISNKLDEMHEHYGPSQVPAKNSNSEIFEIQTLTSSLFSESYLEETNSKKIENCTNSLESSHSDPKVLQKRLDCSTSSQPNNTVTVDNDPCCSKRLQPYLTENATSSNSDVLEARAARLKRLEDQCKSLYVQVTKTNQKSNEICNKLQELHEIYGSSEEPSSNVDTTQENMTQESIDEDSQLK